MEDRKTAAKEASAIASAVDANSAWTTERSQHLVTRLQAKRFAQIFRFLDEACPSTCFDMVAASKGYQYINRQGGLVLYHQRTHNAFLLCGFLDHDAGHPQECKVFCVGERQVAPC